MKEMFPDIWELKKNELNIAEFTRCLRLTWWKIDQGWINRLIDTMPNRLRAVKKARSWYTKY